MKQQNNYMRASRDLIEQVTADHLSMIIEEKKYVIIDVRTPDAIEKQGNIQGAINIPFESIEQALDDAHKDYNPVFKTEGPFLFCCTGGVMSYMAAMKAQEKGICNVYNLEDGHAGWLKFKESKIAV